MRRAAAGVFTLLCCAWAAVAFTGVPHATSIISHHRQRSSSLLHKRAPPKLHAVIPGDSVVELVAIGGTVNFLSIYNALITTRILLSWFPQAAGVAALRPVYVVTEPFLSLFRGLIPPIGGFDLSLIPALLLLQAAGNSVAALGADPSLLGGVVH